MSKEEAYFPEGFFFKEPHPNAPAFVKGSASIKVAEFKDYLSKVKGEWLNLDLKVSQNGKAYAQVNTFKPDPNKQAQPDKYPDAEPATVLEDDQSLPF